MTKSKSSKILGDIKYKIKNQLSSVHPLKKPGLAVIVNSDIENLVEYAANLKKDCEDVGINWFSIIINSETDLQFIYRMIDDFNEMEDINSIIVQLPLPEKFNENKDNIINRVSNTKLIDVKLSSTIFSNNELSEISRASILSVLPLELL